MPQANHDGGRSDVQAKAAGPFFASRWTHLDANS